jgi:predicted GTPase
MVSSRRGPPTFTLFTNGRLPQTYIRYIERGRVEKFEFGATPMKLCVRIGGK